jgi:hypothetical protein
MIVKVKQNGKNKNNRNQRHTTTTTSKMPTMRTYLDTQKTKPNKMPKMLITILEQTTQATINKNTQYKTKEAKTMTTTKQTNDTKLLSPKTRNRGK